MSEIETNPNDKSLWYAFGSLLAKSGEHEKAVEAFGRVTWLDPLHLKAWDAKGKALMRLGRFQEALECYERATELDPIDERLWCQRGEILLCLGKLKEALQCFERAIEIDPNCSDAWYGRGQALREMDQQTVPRDLSEAEMSKEALERERIRLSGPKTRGLSRADYLDAPESDGTQRQPAEDPRTKEDLLLAANMQRYGGNTEEALRLYDKVLESDPSFLDAWYFKGTLLYIMDRFEEASDCFEKALEIRPDHEWSKKRLAEIEALMGKRRLREADGETATGEGPKERASSSDTEAFRESWERTTTRDELMKRANECVLSGELEAAVAYYDNVLEIDWNDWRAWKEKGGVYSMMGREEDATECFERALKLNPRDVSLWLNEGRTLRSRGDKQEALVALRRALELNPELADAWFEAGSILQSLGQSRDAHNAIREAFEHYFIEMLQGSREGVKTEQDGARSAPRQESTEQIGPRGSQRMRIDRFDRNILLALWGRGGTARQLSRRLGIPVAECHRRVKRLHSLGILRCHRLRSLFSPDKGPIELYKVEQKEGVVLLQGDRLILEIPFSGKNRRQHAKLIGNLVRGP